MARLSLKDLLEDDDGNFTFPTVGGIVDKNLPSTQADIVNSLRGGNILKASRQGFEGITGLDVPNIERLGEGLSPRNIKYLYNKGKSAYDIVSGNRNDQITAGREVANQQDAANRSTGFRGTLQSLADAAGIDGYSSNYNQIAAPAKARVTGVKSWFGAGEENDQEHEAAKAQHTLDVANQKKSAYGSLLDMIKEQKFGDTQINDQVNNYREGALGSLNKGYTQNLINARLGHAGRGTTNSSEASKSLQELAGAYSQGHSQAIQNSDTYGNSLRNATSSLFRNAKNSVAGGGDFDASMFSSGIGGLVDAAKPQSTASALTGGLLGAAGIGLDTYGQYQGAKKYNNALPALRANNPGLDLEEDGDTSSFAKYFLG